MRAVARLYRIIRDQSARIQSILRERFRKISRAAERQHVEPEVMIIGHGLFGPVAAGRLETAAAERDSRMPERIVKQDHPSDLQIRFRHGLRTDHMTRFVDEFGRTADETEPRVLLERGN